MKIKIIPLLVLLCTFVSCVSELNIAYEDSDRLLHLQAVAVAGEPLTAKVSRVISVNEDSHQVFDFRGLEAIVTVNGEEQYEMTPEYLVTNVIFTTEYCPSPNDEIRLVVSDKNGHFNELAAETSVPAIVELEAVLGGAFGNRHIDCRFRDPDGDNYYRFSCIEKNANAEEGSSQGISIPQTLNEFFGERDSVGPFFSKATHFFSDEHAPGHELKFECPFKFGDRENMQEWQKTIVLENISKECYLYFKSLEDMTNKSQVDVFSEPQYIYSNVSGGLGFFVSATRSAKKIVFGQSSAEHVHPDKVYLLRDGGEVRMSVDAEQWSLDSVRVNKTNNHLFTAYTQEIFSGSRAKHTNAYFDAEVEDGKLVVNLHEASFSMIQLVFIFFFHSKEWPGRYLDSEMITIYQETAF